MSFQYVFIITKVKLTYGAHFMTYLILYSQYTSKNIPMAAHARLAKSGNGRQTSHLNANTRSNFTAGMFHSMSWPCSYVEQHLVLFGVIHSSCGFHGAPWCLMDLKCSHTESNFKMGLTPSLNNVFFFSFFATTLCIMSIILIKANILSRRLLLSLGLMPGKTTRVLQQQGLTDLVGNTVDNTVCE